MRVRCSLFGLSALTCILAITAVLGAASYRVSLDSLGDEGNNASWLPSLSGDGSIVAFISLANDLVDGDTNGVRDIFVRNFVAGTTARVSVASDGAQSNGDSWGPSISSDARYVAFSSTATNLVAGDTNGRMDVFLHDRTSGATTRVSVATGGGEGNGDSRTPSVSSDGRYVAFASDATNLVPGDGNGSTDIFVHDTQTGTTEWISIGLPGLGSSGTSRDPSISSDGRFVAFNSAASNLVADDLNFKDDIFVRDRQGGVTALVSVGLDGAQANGPSQDPAISGNGEFVAFKSYATNLVADDMNLRCDVFVFDRIAGTIERASVSTGGVEGTYDSLDPAISGNGDLVAFASRSTNFSGYDTNGFFDIFVRDRVGGITQQVTGSALNETNNHSWGPAVVGASGGPMVAFWSEASNLVPGDSNEKPDVFMGTPGAGGEYGICYGLTADGGVFSGMYTIYVPININYSTDVAGIDFKLLFDPAIVQLADVTTSGPAGDTVQVLTGGWQMQYNINNEEGWVAVSMASDVPMAPPDETGRICYLIFSATPEAAGTSTSLAFEYVLIYDDLGMPLPLCEGGSGGECRMFLELAECPHVADVDRNQSVDSSDAILLLQAAVDLPMPLDWPYDWPPLACNDVNGDGVITSGDAVLVLAYAASGGLIPLPEPGSATSAAALTASAVSRSVSLPDTTVDPGGTVSVPIIVDDATGIAGADFDVYFDSALLEVVAVNKAALTSDFFLGHDTDTPGRVGIAMARATGIAAGSGPLLSIEFRSLGRGGSTALHLGECKLFDQTPAPIPVTPNDGAIQVVYSTGFSDVAPEHWAADEIVACAQAGIVSGYPDSSYQPGVVVPRDQMAAFVARAIAGGESQVPVVTTTPSFTDVPQLHWAFKYVEYCKDQAVVTGFTDGLYRPGLEVNRGQMAAFVARATVAPSGDAAIPAPVPPDNFPDVTATNQWADIHPYVEYLADLGVVTGYDDGLYHPTALVTRDLMAVYIARAFGLI